MATINDKLRFLVRRCLKKDPKECASLAEALALIYLFGGVCVTTSKRPEVWSTELKGLESCDMDKIDCAGPKILQSLRSITDNIKNRN